MLHLAVGTTLCVLSVVFCYIIFRKYVRPRYPVKVTCWFCGSKACVPYQFSNNWDCQSCEQYNGFKEDGDYNKSLPAQYDERYNKPVQSDGSEYLAGPDILCTRCSQNQLLKVKQLASFVPFNEKNFEAEVEAFEQHLEKVYRPCLACEIKVKQELGIQNEALVKRLSNLDQWHRLVRHDENEDQVQLLHSSYSDRRKNRQITASIVLHLVACLCSMGLLLGQLDLASIHLPGLDPFRAALHPYFVWLDNSSNFLLGLGLCCGILAKLVLGKYRLFIMDAIACPVWLLVLLPQTGFLPLEQSGSLLICLHVCNSVVSTVCLSRNRRRRNQSTMNISRLSMDNTDSCSSVSSVSPFSSISQVPENRPDLEQSASLGSKVTCGERSEVSQARTKIKTTSTDENGVTSTSENTCLFSAKQTDDDSGSIVDDTASDLFACSLGEPSSPKTSTGYTLANFFSNLNDRSISDNLRDRQGNQSRPLISPGRFSHSPVADGHTTLPSTPIGLFSDLSASRSSSPFVSSPLGGHSSLWRPSPQRPSAFNPLNHLATRPPSVQRNSPSFSDIRVSRSELDRQQKNSGTSSLRSFRLIRERPSASDRRHYESDTDLEDECDMSSITSRLPDSTSTVRTDQLVPVPLWRHPALIGFLLGGSIVANVILTLQSVWREPSR